MHTEVNEQQAQVNLEESCESNNLLVVTKQNAANEYYMKEGIDKLVPVEPTSKILAAGLSTKESRKSQQSTGRRSFLLSNINTSGGNYAAKQVHVPQTTQHQAANLLEDSN